MLIARISAALGLVASVALGLAVVLPANAQGKTPSTPAGPYYPTDAMRFTDQDADLVQIKGHDQQADGDVLVLSGIVYGPDGNPAAGALVEIWQTDNNARYIHTSERANRPADPNFQGYGQAITDSQGQYVFRTIVPQTYPGRTPHIHVKVAHQRTRLTSQFYIDQHPGNQNDPLWRLMRPEQRQVVTMRFFETQQGFRSSVDIRL